MEKIYEALKAKAEELEEPQAASDPAAMDWKRIICFAIPVYNVIAPFTGLPVLPIPAFCDA